ncbi:MAG: ORF6N domain-containing protein [Thiobacillus sp.]
MEQNSSLVPERIAQRIHFVRGHKVMLDADLASLYGVETRVLVQAVKRNSQRFPPDFMFQLADAEWAALRSQFVTSKGRGGRRYAPYVFTEHGALMLSSVLNSDTAADVGILVVRTFVQLREMLSTHKELAAKLEALERKIGSHDQAIAGLIDAIRQLMTPPEQSKRPIGFIAADAMSGKAKK